MPHAVWRYVSLYTYRTVLASGVLDNLISHSEITLIALRGARGTGVQYCRLFVFCTLSDSLSRVESRRIPLPVYCTVSCILIKSLIGDPRRGPRALATPVGHTAAVLHLQQYPSRVRATLL